MNDKLAILYIVRLTRKIHVIKLSPSCPMRAIGIFTVFMQKKKTGIFS